MAHFGSRANGTIQAFEKYFFSLLRQSDIFCVQSDRDGRTMSLLVEVIYILKSLNPHIWEPLWPPLSLIFDGQLVTKS